MRARANAAAPAAEHEKATRDGKTAATVRPGGGGIFIYNRATDSQHRSDFLLGAPQTVERSCKDPAHLLKDRRRKTGSGRKPCRSLMRLARMLAGELDVADATFAPLDCHVAM